MFLFLFVVVTCALIKINHLFFCLQSCNYYSRFLLTISDVAYVMRSIAKTYHVGLDHVSILCRLIEPLLPVFFYYSLSLRSSIKGKTNNSVETVHSSHWLAIT
jgi:hypothetical protein